jgi:hypothetical protein
MSFFHLFQYRQRTLCGHDKRVTRAKSVNVLPDSRANFVLSVGESSEVGIVRAITLGTGTGKTNEPMRAVEDLVTVQRSDNEVSIYR